jgi:hypothetical protein
MKRFCLVTTGLLLGFLSGCRERNPAYIQDVVHHDAAGQADAAADVLGDASVPPPDAVILPDDVVETAPGPDRGPDGPIPPIDAGSPTDDGGVDVRDARDARDTRRTSDDVPDAILGDDGPRDVPDVARPADTNDAPVLLSDGGVDTVALDTAPIDLPPLCPEQQTRTCSTPGNPLIGACHAGTQTCTGGAWGACTGEILPGSAELCNGLDDNCNGVTDEACAADCVVVAPGGNSDTPDGTAAHPFASVAAGLAAAAGIDGGAPGRVCVAGGATCADAYTYAMDAALTVPNGVRVQGNYALDGSVLRYCADTQPPTTTLQFTVAGASVKFGDGVTAPTELGGFVIKRFSQSNVGSTSGPSAAVSISGGKNITLSGIFVTDAPAGDTTYGVDVERGGQVTIVGSAIGGGNGKIGAIGVYVNGGSVNLRDNCDGVFHGVCATACAAGTLGIRGRAGTSTGAAAADSSAVYVTGGSPAPSTLVGNMLCGGSANAADGSLGANVATLRCEGGACATVTGNGIAGGSGRLTLAVSLASGPALVEANAIAAGCGTEGALGVLLDGSSARLRNNRIFGSGCTTAVATGSYFGVRVVLASGGGEPDVNSNDIDPWGGSGDCQSTGVAIERSQGQPAPAGFFRNNIIAAGNCRTRTAISEGANATARLIENNDLYAQPPSAGTGVTTVLFHRASTDATTIAQVNALDGAARNISANPRFMGYPSDLHLAADSPCIDQGTPEGAPAIDAEGNARPHGAGFDIGAYELVSP